MVLGIALASLAFSVIALWIVVGKENDDEEP